MMTTRNAAFQRFETLKRNREKRTKQQLFFLEGVHPIEQALLHGWTFQAMGYQRGVRLSGWAQDMLHRAQPEERYEIAPELMRELSDRDEPCELIALVRMKRGEWRDTGRAALLVLFDRPQSPGNLGSVIRSADAFSADMLLTTGHGADFYDPQCIRASIGTVFALPFLSLGSADEAMNLLSGLPQPPQIIGTSAKGDRMIDEVDFTKPTLLLIGNETFGLSKAWKERSDLLVKIPIEGAASSLNAASAASICLYEAARQRRS